MYVITYSLDKWFQIPGGKCIGKLYPPDAWSTPEISSVQDVALALDFNHNPILSPFVPMISWVNIENNTAAWGWSPPWSPQATWHYLHHAYRVRGLRSRLYDRNCPRRNKYCTFAATRACLADCYPSHRRHLDCQGSSLMAISKRRSCSEIWDKWLVSISVQQ